MISLREVIERQRAEQAARAATRAPRALAPVVSTTNTLLARDDVLDRAELPSNTRSSFDARDVTDSDVDAFNAIMRSLEEQPYTFDTMAFFARTVIVTASAFTPGVYLLIQACRPYIGALEIRRVDRATVEVKQKVRVE